MIFSSIDLLLEKDQGQELKLKIKLLLSSLSHSQQFSRFQKKIQQRKLQQFLLHLSLRLYKNLRVKLQVGQDLIDHPISESWRKSLKTSIIIL